MLNQIKSSWKLIALAGVIAGFSGWGLGYGALMKYKSNSVLNFEMRAADYRKFQESLVDLRNFERYTSNQAFKDNKAEFTEDLRQQIFRQQKWLEPIQRVSRQDAKELAIEAKSIDDATIFGLKLTAQDSNPERAQKLTELQADYVMDTTLRVNLLDYLQSQYIAKFTQFDKAESERLRNEYEIASTQNRLKELRRIGQAYPDAARVDARQLITIDKLGERYMPIPSQMAALETHIVDLREQNARSERDLKKHPLEVALLKEQLEQVEKANLGKDAVLKAIALAQQKLSKATDEWARQAYLDNFNYMADLRVKYIDKRSYIIAPTLPTIPEQPRPFTLAVIFAILGGLLSSAWVFRSQLIEFFKEEPELAVTGSTTH